MPLDVDQYAIRRTYRNGTAYIGENKPKRNENGNLVGYEFVPAQKIAYKVATLTQTDAQFYGDVVDKVSKKIEIPPSKIIRERQNALTVKIDETYYNVKQLDDGNARRWYLYLEKNTKKGTVHNG